MAAVVILIESNAKFKIKAFIEEYSERECFYLCLWNIQYVHCTYVYVSTYWMYSVSCLCMFVCLSSVPIRLEWRSVPLGCLADISCPLFFRKWMQPITIQGFINSLWATWSYRGLMNSVCETLHAKCPPPNPVINRNGWDKAMNLSFFSFFLFSIYAPISLPPHPFLFECWDCVPSAWPLGADLFFCALCPLWECRQNVPCKMYPHWKLVLVHLMLQTYIHPEMEFTNR